MKSKDVFFADPVVVPEDERQYYTEEVRYLPNVVSAFFPHEFPEIAPLPALTSKVVTFGSFNRLAKVSVEAFKLWSEVLLAVPDSRMIIKAPELDNRGARNRVMGHFLSAGVAPERITLLGKTNWHEHVTAFNQVDISLDPFPQGGGVTTLEGLMMGVPVVALRWPTLVGRLSASILITTGLSEWVADTQEQYLEIALQKSRDLNILAGLRLDLRKRFKSSIIGDVLAYATAVEDEYRKLWREWCRKSVEEDNN